jgi:uncharacterized protein (TIGR03083 family)
MEKAEVWRVIDAQKVSLTDQLLQLSHDEWEHPSLCVGWTVRDVVAHLTLQHITVATAVVEMVRARGNVDRMIHDAACRRAARPVEHLVADLRAQVGSRRHPPVVTYLEALIDVLVHGQHVVVPLDRTHPMPPDSAAVAASRVWHLGAPWHAKRTMQGFRLTATDTAWSVGEGTEVRGPIDAILLALTGRPAKLSSLSGEGAAALTAQLQAAHS